ncbi:MAG: 16S rRNA (cytidine(1402)-2'-O)-methyltransferase [Pseudomonadota bacterium]
MTGRNDGDDPTQRAPVEPGLYLVATPIGNLEDLTPRALRVLRDVDRVYCEDTRVTGKLLSVLGCPRSLAAYHEHNAERLRPVVLAALAAGESVALTSDAGTPLVSDPGFKLVRDAIEADHPVTPIPGPSAPIAALIASGLPTDRFFFQGFLPTKGGARERVLAELAGYRATLVLFESAARSEATLRDLARAFGARPAALARELTKRHEEIRRGDLAMLADGCAADPPRGEVVLVVGGAGDTAPDVDVEHLLQAALQGRSPSEAAKLVAKATGRPRAELYRLALGLQRS